MIVPSGKIWAALPFIICIEAVPLHSSQPSPLPSALHSSLHRRVATENELLIGYKTTVAAKYRNAGDTLVWDESLRNSEQLGEGVYITPTLGEWESSLELWQCAVSADETAWNSVNKAWVPAIDEDDCKALWWPTGISNRPSYLKGLTSTYTATNTVLLSQIDGFQSLQFLIPPQLLSASDGSLKIKVRCAGNKDASGVEIFDEYGAANWDTWMDIKGMAPSLTVSAITVTPTSTEDPICAPDTCAGICSSEKSSIFAPALQPDPKVTDTPLISPREIPKVADPTWGFLDKQLLVVWMLSQVTSFPWILQLYPWIAPPMFSNHPLRYSFLSGIRLFLLGSEVFLDALLLFWYRIVGCTWYVKTNTPRIGEGLGLATNQNQTHFWETPFRRAASKALSTDIGLAFRNTVLEPFKDGSTDPPFKGLSQLPGGCFTSAENVQAMIYSRTYRKVPKPYYPAQVTQIQDIISDQLGITAPKIKIQYYDATEESIAMTADTATGKVMLTYNPDVFGNGKRTAYQVWSAQLLIDGEFVTKNADINTPLLSDFWKPDFTSKKRDVWEDIDYLNITNWF